MHGLELGWTGAWCGCVRCGGDGAGRDRCMILNWDGQVHGVAVSGVAVSGVVGWG